MRFSSIRIETLQLYIFTLTKQAKHFKKWAKRMEELGSKYGELPAHAGLWQSATETSDSLIARLSVVHMVRHSLFSSLHSNF